MNVLFGFLTIVLLLVSIVMILLVLMQRGSAAGGLGAAMGGGMAESALGADSSNVLSRWTRNVAIVFFVLVFGLYLGTLWDHENQKAAAEASGLPEFATEQEGTDAGLDFLLQDLTSESEAATDDAGADAEALAVDLMGIGQDEAEAVADPVAEDPQTRAE